MFYFCCRYLGEEFFWHSTPGRLSAMAAAHNRFENPPDEKSGGLAGLQSLMSTTRK